MVRPASRMFNAISFGVFWRSAPSTNAIMRSRNVSPGLDVILILMQSESTRVPPVTAERSPPASRITGADSPVIADSSTDATPSTISPSPGMNSPADTFTTSPERSFELATFSIVRSGKTRLATVSDLALRRLSACALPRPSAIASAKFANSTVNHSQSMICTLKPNAPWWRSAPRTSNTLVTTLPTSTTNMTGLPIILRGCSFTSESQIARCTIFMSQIALPFAIIPQKRPSKSLAGLHQQVLKDRTQAQCREERQRSHNHDHAYQQYTEQRCGHGKRAQRRRNIFFLRQVPGNRQHGKNHEEAPD